MYACMHALRVRLVYFAAEWAHSAPCDLHKKLLLLQSEPTQLLVTCTKSVCSCRASPLSALWLAQKVCVVAERAYSAPFDLHKKCVLLQREPTQHPLTCTKSVCCCRESLLSPSSHWGESGQHTFPPVAGQRHRADQPDHALSVWWSVFFWWCWADNFALA